MFSRFTSRRSSFLPFLTFGFLLVLVIGYRAIQHEDHNFAVVARAVVSPLGQSTSLPPTDTSSLPTSTTDTSTTTTSSQSTIAFSLSITPILSPPPSTTTTQSTSSSAQSSVPGSTSLVETTSLIQTVNSNGQPTNIVVTVLVSATPSASPAAANSNGGGSSSTVGSGTIIGLSVCGGVAAIGILAFIIWKLSRKRATDRFDDTEAIKWPELNNENHADGGFSSEVNLTRGGSSRGGYEPSIGTASQSQVDLYAADPYAVPPLPHLNPGHPQPYRDDPTGGSYYDAYPGVPNDYHNISGNPNIRVEAIPMTQIPPGTRARSPGPQMGFSGRASPAPAIGRQSPGPQTAYGYSR